MRSRHAFGLLVPPLFPTLRRAGFSHSATNTCLRCGPVLPCTNRYATTVPTSRNQPKPFPEQHPQHSDRRTQQSMPWEGSERGPNNDDGRVKKKKKTCKRKKRTNRKKANRGCGRQRLSEAVRGCHAGRGRQRLDLPPPSRGGHAFLYSSSTRSTMCGFPMMIGHLS